MNEDREQHPRLYDMTKPCPQCPFSTVNGAIRFRNRDRAEEIEEYAYRHGFPCHTTAELVEHADGWGQQDGFYFGKHTQHCAGYIIMALKSGYDTWPGIDNDDKLSARLQDQIDWYAPVFDNTEAFFEANSQGENQTSS